MRVELPSSILSELGINARELEFEDVDEPDARSNKAPGAEGNRRLRVPRGQPVQQRPRALENTRRNQEPRKRRRAPAGQRRPSAPRLPERLFTKPEPVIVKPDPKKHWSKYKQATLAELILDYVRRHAEPIPVPELSCVAVRWRKKPHVKEIREAVRALVIAGAIRTSGRADAVQRI